MIKVWFLTIAYGLSSGTATEKYGPYPDLEACQKAASETVYFDDVNVDSWGARNAKPMNCVPEYR